MSRTSLKRMSIGLLTALLLTTVPAYAVKTYKISSYGGGHQIWFEAEDFDQRDPDTDQYFPVVDHAGAFGRTVSRAGGAGGMIRYTFNISKADGKGGTWYFWGRIIDPSNQSDFMLVDGNPGNPTLPTAPPYPGTSSAPGFTNEMRIFEEDVANWGWARRGHEEAHTKQLRDGENTMRIVHRQGDSTVFWDVFMWTDNASYVPTDADYQNAAPAPLETSATNPDPKNGAVVEATWASLAWAPAVRAVSHNVYLADRFEDVNTSAAGALRGNVTVPVFVVGLGMPGDPYPAGLVPGTTYYWRVDEVNQADPNSPWRGDIWSFSIPPKKAYKASPADGALYIDPTGTTLSWVAGLGAKLHYVYFGDNFDTVNNATKGIPQPIPSYTPAGPLAKGKTYYWRVDEFDGAATNKGDVWSFTTLPNITVSDPNLSGWWKLDEGQGRVAVDWSGHNNHGKIEGNAKWTAGYDGGALDLDGTGARVIDDDGESYLNGLRALTIALWVKSRLTGTDKGFIEGEVPGSGNDSFCTIRYDAAGSSFGGTNVMKMAVTSAPGGEQQLESSSNVQTTEWQHIAMTWESAGLIRLYINGAEDNPSGRNGPNNAGVTSGCTAFVIGQGSKDAGGGWNGLVDDVRVYNKALNADQIKQIMRGDFSRSWNPSPANGSTSDVVRAATLSWSRGDKASQHDVYFGLDKAAVGSATATDTTGIYRGRQSATSYTPPEGVQFNGGPYYWRIDEVNTDGSITAGTLWVFSVAGYILIDDFEAYNDIAAGQAGSNLVYMTWLDGFGTTTNGSTMGYPTGASLETANRHGGAKAAPLIYNNATASFSEVERTLAAQNWTSNGIQTLSLWFRGDSTNVPGQLYVKINGVKVLYDGDAANLKKPIWQPWNITLASVGTNLQSVTKLAIGIETKGTSGTLLLDDIRLYPLPRQLVTPVQPDPTGLAARFAFEGNANNSVAGGRNGTPNGGPTYALGKIGQAIVLDGVDDYVAVGSVGIAGAAPRTISGWAKVSATTWPAWVNVFGFTGPSGNNGHFDIELVGDSGTTATLGWYGLHVYGAEWNILPADSDWHHLAATYDGTTAKWYGDGLLVGSAARTLNPPDNVHVGKRQDNTNFFQGSVDEVQIYSRVLSEAEVAGLAGMTKPYDKPL